MAAIWADRVSQRVQAVLLGASPRCRLEQVDSLAVLRPEVYAGWTPAQLAAARPAGALPQQVWGQAPDGTGTNRNGYVLAEISRAISP